HFRSTPPFQPDLLEQIEDAPVEEARHPLPPVMLEPLPPPPAFPRPLSPSGASLLIETTGEPIPSPLSPVLDAARKPGFALERGTAIHRLLQLLPELPPDERERVARRFL